MREQGRYQVVCGPDLPVAKLVIGKPAVEAAALLPRLFNLCRAAQATAAAMAMGLPAPDVDLSGEILRDHLVKLTLTWPRLVGLDPLPLPENWQAGGAALLDQLFETRFPETPAAFEAALLSGAGLAPLFVALAKSLRPGFGAGPALPVMQDAEAFAPGAYENSVAGRQVDHPVLRAIEATRGRDLYWRAVARLYDLADAAQGNLPPPRMAGAGRALVPAARGTYAVAATLEAGVVTEFTRVTPTDHLLAENGIADITIAGFADPDQRTIHLAMDILDPCIPMELKERNHA